MALDYIRMASNNHYKDLEPGKWVKIDHWGHADEAKALITAAIKRAAAAKA